MYDKFYRLSALPFQLIPDAQFFFESTVHRQAMAYLSYGLCHAGGFIVITGEIGAGKTILVDHLLSALDYKKFIIGRIVTTMLLRLAPKSTRFGDNLVGDRKSTRLNSSHITPSRMPSSA